ncbi:MAG: AAA domain-containing protein [Proteobacteria bacterium]|nr:AAA domain-containing protein [Pseudomonadota bacterium]
MSQKNQKCSRDVILVRCIEKADGGIFFLDEAHNLPRRVQKSLLRVVEDGKIGRIGETDSKEVDVRFVFASNEPPKSFGLEKDLLARLMVIEIPPLNERPADIPDIFDRLLNEAQLRAGVSLQLTRESVRASQYETLMLDGFEQDNVRGLIKIADAIATRAATGLQPEMAIDEIFDELYNTQYGSSRDAGFGDLKFTKQIEKADNTSSGKVSDIEAAYYKHGGNVAAI